MLVLNDDGTLSTEPPGEPGRATGAPCGKPAVLDREANTIAPAPEPSFRWVVLAASWAILTVAAGFIFFALPLYMAELGASSGISIGRLSAATSFFYVALALGGLPVGWLINRVDVRWVMAVGCAVGAVGFLTLGRVAVLWQVYLAYGLLGTSFAAVTFIPLTTVVFRWFVRRRSFAVTVLMCGQAAGGGLVTPVVSSLVKDRGLPLVAPTLALGYLALTVSLTLLFIRANPPEGGVRTGDSARTAVPEESGSAASDAPGKRRPAFPFVCFVMSLVPCAAIGVMTHLPTLGAEREVVAIDAMVPLVAIASGVGTFVILPLLARASASAATAIVAASQTLAVLLLASAFSTVPFALGALVLGLGLGAFLVLMPLVLLDFYARSEYASRYAMLTLFVNLGVAVGPGTLGALRSLVTEYRLPLLALSAAPMLATGLLWLLARRYQRVLPQEMTMET